MGVAKDNHILSGFQNSYIISQVGISLHLALNLFI